VEPGAGEGGEFAGRGAGEARGQGSVEAGDDFAEEFAVAAAEDETPQFEDAQGGDGVAGSVSTVLSRGRK
jgi:hypothetical protein